MRAAAWISRRRALYARVLRAAHRGIDLRKELQEGPGTVGGRDQGPVERKRTTIVPCRNCDSRGCQACGHTGRVEREAAEQAGDVLPKEMTEIVSVWAEIEQRGVEGFLAIARESGETRELAEVCVDAVRVISGEVGRLEFEREVEEALEEARQRKRGTGH